MWWKGVVHIYKQPWCSVRLALPQRMQSSACLWYVSATDTHVKSLSRHLNFLCTPCGHCALGCYTPADVFTLHIMPPGVPPLSDLPVTLGMITWFSLPHTHVDQPICTHKAYTAHTVTRIIISAAHLCSTTCNASDLVPRGFAGVRTEPCWVIHITMLILMATD